MDGHCPCSEYIFSFLSLKDVEFGYMEGAMAFVTGMVSMRRQNVPFHIN